jgi:hypothetical protein
VVGIPDTTNGFFPAEARTSNQPNRLRYTCLILVWAAEHYRRLTKRLEDEQKFRELAVEELAHRLKNKSRYNPVNS